MGRTKFAHVFWAHYGTGYSVKLHLQNMVPPNTVTLKPPLPLELREADIQISIPVTEQEINFRIDHRAFDFMITNFYLELVKTELTKLRKKSQRSVPSNAEMAILGEGERLHRLSEQIAGTTMFADFLENLVKNLLLWDWHGNQKIKVPENFFASAFTKAKEIAVSTKSADVDLPQLLDFLKINTVRVMHMELTETFCRFRSETSRLQKMLLDLGFQQPIFYDIVNQCKFLPVPSYSSSRYCRGLARPNLGNIFRMNCSVRSPLVLCLSRDPRRQ